MNSKTVSKAKKSAKKTAQKQNPSILQPKKVTIKIEFWDSEPRDEIYDYDKLNEHVYLRSDGKVLIAAADKRTAVVVNAGRPIKRDKIKREKFVNNDVVNNDDWYIKEANRILSAGH